ncbi:MAG: hypothetical protein V5B40_07745 [Candidatus Accumulibacter meliphilus]|jgi:hypothetical protein|uniref:hypothetical protein n=1 Tax=Candidatus Accumulibacter meliphilus TaxID=2211374 RepID=UPI002FC3A4CC
MQGAGLVRSLREAASLPTAAGSALATQLAAYAAETTRSGQLARLDGLLKVWADTSSMATFGDAQVMGAQQLIATLGVHLGDGANSFGSFSKCDDKVYDPDRRRRLG